MMHKLKEKMEMEDQINFIIEKYWEEIQSGCGPKTSLRLAILDAYKAGIEESRKIFKSSY